jgi:FO synthase subunit 2
MKALRQKMIPEDIENWARNGLATREDALKLLIENPFELFDLADRLRRESVGDDVTYVVNRNIYITNMCKGGCKFCSFNQRDGYILTIPQILERVKAAHEAGATEVCILGGFIPKLDLDFYLDIVKAIKKEYPNISIHGFSPMEISHAAGVCDISTERAFRKLKKAGLGTLTGTSAEILSERVRGMICPNKITTEEWIETIMTAHKADLVTNSTIMYGHIETWEEKIEHLLILRDIQQKTGKFTELVPMPFMPYNNIIGEKMMREGKYGPGGIEDLKLHAIARLLLNKHIPNIQASWVKLGKKLAQVALNCGANDLGGTLMEDQITLASGGKNGEYLPSGEMEWIIGEIGRRPVRRDTYYRECK